MADGEEEGMLPADVQDAQTQVKSQNHDCSECDETFQEIQDLLKHLDTHTCSCTHCGKEFANKDYLEQHMRTHNVSPGTAQEPHPMHEAARPTEGIETEHNPGGDGPQTDLHEQKEEGSPRVLGEEEKGLGEDKEKQAEDDGTCSRPDLDTDEEVAPSHETHGTAVVENDEQNSAVYSNQEEMMKIEKPYKCSKCRYSAKCVASVHIHQRRQHPGEWTTVVSLGQTEQPDKPEISPSNLNSSEEEGIEGEDDEEEDDDEDDDDDSNDNEESADSILSSDDDEPVYHCSVCTYSATDTDSVFKHQKEAHPSDWQLNSSFSSNEGEVFPSQTSTVTKQESASQTPKTSDEAKVNYVLPTDLDHFQQTGRNIIAGSSNVQLPSQDAFSVDWHVGPGFRYPLQKTDQHGFSSVLKVQQYRCMECPEIFIDKIKLKTHIDIYHNGMKRYRCTICNKRFHLMKPLRRHLMTHQNFKPYKCSECNYTGKRRDNVRKHQKQRHPTDAEAHVITLVPEREILNILKNYVKVGPDESFQVRENRAITVSDEEEEQGVLMGHPQSRPLMMKMGVSGVCGQSAYSTGHQLLSPTIVNSIIACSSNVDNSTVASSVSSNGSQDQSQLEDDSNQTLEQLESHSAELAAFANESLEKYKSGNNYICPECPVLFRESYKLRRHMEIHMGVKRHSCNICGKRFTRLEHLKRHRMVHANTKPFLCSACGYSSKRLDNLQKHQKVKHPHLLCHVVTVSKEMIEAEIAATAAKAPPEPPPNPTLTVPPKRGRPRKISSPDDTFSFGGSPFTQSTPSKLSGNGNTSFDVSGPLTSTPITSGGTGFVSGHGVPDDAMKFANSGGNKGRYKCHVCDRPFSYLKPFKKHLLCHGTFMPYECSVCKYQTKRRDSMQDHQRAFHPDEPCHIIIMEPTPDMHDMMDTYIQQVPNEQTARHESPPPASSNISTDQAFFESNANKFGLESCEKGLAAFDLKEVTPIKIEPREFTPSHPFISGEWVSDGTQAGTLRFQSTSAVSDTSLLGRIGMQLPVTQADMALQLSPIKIEPLPLDELPTAPSPTQMFSKEIMSQVEPAYLMQDTQKQSRGQVQGQQKRLIEPPSRLPKPLLEAAAQERKTSSPVVFSPGPRANSGLVRPQPRRVQMIKFKVLNPRPKATPSQTVAKTQQEVKPSTSSDQSKVEKPIEDKTISAHAPENSSNESTQEGIKGSIDTKEQSSNLSSKVQTTGESTNEKSPEEQQEWNKPENIEVANNTVDGSKERVMLKADVERDSPSKQSKFEKSKTSINHKFACHICDQKFAYEKPFKRHLLVHGGFKPYLCDVCHHQTTTRDAMKIHQHKTHMGVLSSITVLEPTAEVEENLLAQGLSEPKSDEDPSTKSIVEMTMMEKHKMAAVIKNLTSTVATNISQEDAEPSFPMILGLRPIRPAVADGLLGKSDSFASETTDSHSFDNSYNDNDNSQDLNSEYDGRSKTYTCPFCCKDFRSSSKLQRHMVSHTGFKAYECHLCKKRFTRLEHLKRHLLTHGDIKPYKCSACDYYAKRADNIQMHQKTRHPGEFVDVVCTIPLPESVVPRRTRLPVTMSGSSERPYLCTDCGQTFAQIQRLRRHEKIHSGVKPYECFVCHKTFTRPEHLKRHHLVHDDTKPYSCSECDFVTKRVDGMKEHQRSRHPTTQTFIVDTILPDGQSIIDLRKDTQGEDAKDLYEDLKLVYCNQCTLAFYDVKRLEQHLVSHQNTPIRREDLTCPVCNLQLSQMKHLKRHLLLHEKTSPFQCSKCGYRTTRLDHIQRHIRKQHISEEAEVIKLTQQSCDSLSLSGPSGSGQTLDLNEPSTSVAIQFTVKEEDVSEDDYEDESEGDDDMNDSDEIYPDLYSTQYIDPFLGEPVVGTASFEGEEGFMDDSAATYEEGDKLTTPAPASPEDAGPVTDSRTLNGANTRVSTGDLLDTQSSESTPDDISVNPEEQSSDRTLGSDAGPKQLWASHEPGEESTVPSKRIKLDTDSLSL